MSQTNEDPFSRHRGQALEREAADPTPLFDLAKDGPVGDLKKQIRGGYDWKREKHIPPSQEAVRQAIEAYIQGSTSVLETIMIEARKIDFLLLSVTEYEEALQKEGSSNPNLVVIGEVTRARDTFNVNQAGAVGPGAHAPNITFTQIGSQIEKYVDLSNLADELAKLRQAMKKEAVEAEHDIAVSDVAKAEQAARANKASTVAEYLKSAGNWAFEMASKIGAALAAEALKISIGMK